VPSQDKGGKRYSSVAVLVRQLTMDPQIARAKEIKTHFVQTQAREGADARKAAEKAATGVIVNLGLVEESS
jgi:hypothetical protein